MLVWVCFRRTSSRHGAGNESMATWIVCACFVMVRYDQNMHAVVLSQSTATCSCNSHGNTVLHTDLVLVWVCFRRTPSRHGAGNESMATWIVCAVCACLVIRCDQNMHADTSFCALSMRLSLFVDTRGNMIAHVARLLCARSLCVSIVGDTR